MLISSQWLTINPITDRSGVYFLTCTVAKWVAIFTKKDYADITENSLNFCIDKKRLVVYEYIIMSNHMHLHIQARNINLFDVLKDFKKFTSQSITNAIAANDKESRKGWMLWLFKQSEHTETNQLSYQFWQPDNHAEMCFSLSFAWQKLTYIQKDSVREG